MLYQSFMEAMNLGTDAEFEEALEELLTVQEKDDLKKIQKLQRKAFQ